jgi:hypothetical protein
MAKTAKSGSSATEKKAVKKSVMQLHMEKISEAIRTRQGLSLWLLLIASLISLYFMQSVEDTLNYAMLYSVANNGRFSGRADGNVYMRNGRIRAFRVPALVQNGYTALQRSIFSGLSSGWNGLTEAQRLSFINAEGFFTSDRFGNQVPVKGKELYVRLNGNLTDIGAALLTEAPIPAAVPGITQLQITVDDSSNTFLLQFTPTPTDATVEHLVYATSQLSPGINRPGASQFRLISVLANGTVSGADINAAYVVKYGAPLTGRKIFVKLVPVNNTTGQAGVGIIASSIVVA